MLLTGIRILIGIRIAMRHVPDPLSSTPLEAVTVWLGQQKQWGTTWWWVFTLTRKSPPTRAPPFSASRSDTGWSELSRYLPSRIILSSGILEYSITY